MEDLIKEENRGHVQRMLNRGMNKEDIMEILNLTEAEFEELATPLAS